MCCEAKGRTEGNNYWVKTKPGMLFNPL